MKVLGIFTDGGKTNQAKGCGFYRVVQPMEALKRAGHDVEIAGNIRKTAFNWSGVRPETAEEMYKRIFSDVDVIFSQHLNNPDGIAQLFAARDKYKKKVVLDIDDDITNVHPSSPAFAQWKKGEPVRHFTECALAFADAVVVSTEELVPIYKKLNKNVFVLENRVDPTLWEWPKRTYNDAFIRIGYAGSNSHGDDYEVVHLALKRVMERHANVLFGALGFVHPLMQELPAKQFGVIRGTPRYEFAEWPKTLAASGFDIGICPLRRSPFNQGKSPIKYYEYSMTRTATIASGDTALPYASEIIPDATGLLATHERDWDRGLERLVTDAAFRQGLAERAFLSVRSNRNIADYAAKYWRMLEAIYAMQ